MCCKVSACEEPHPLTDLLVLVLSIGVSNLVTAFPYPSPLLFKLLRHFRGQHGTLENIWKAAFLEKLNFYRQGPESLETQVQSGAYAAGLRRPVRSGFHSG